MELEQGNLSLSRLKKEWEKPSSSTQSSTNSSRRLTKMSQASSSKNPKEDIYRLLRVLNSVDLRIFPQLISHKLTSWLLSEKLYRRMAVTTCTITLGVSIPTHYLTQYASYELPVAVAVSSVMVSLWVLAVFKEKTKGRLSITSPTD